MSNQSLVRDVSKLVDLHDPRTITELKAADRSEDGVVTDVTAYSDTTGWAVGYDSEGLDWTCGVPSIEGRPEPRVGSAIRIYGAGWGSAIHGIDLDGEEVYWHTPWERMANRMKLIARGDRQKREAFESGRLELDAKYEDLPAPLKHRIDRFRAAQPDFRVESEAYEMVACVDADRIANVLRPEVRPGCSARDVVKAFADLSWEEQCAKVPGINPGHSGNTFSWACKLAWCLLDGVPV